MVMMDGSMERLHEEIGEQCYWKLKNEFSLCINAFCLLKMEFFLSAQFLSESLGVNQG